VVQQQIRERFHDLFLLGTGLAHVVRNPLHALRLNLHIVRRAMDSHNALAREELLETIEHSDAAIERIEVILRNLVAFVEPAVGLVVNLNLVDEVQAALNQVTSDLQRDQIEVDTTNCSPSIEIQMDSARLREAIHNLLSFVQWRVGKRGKIEIASSLVDGQMELSIAHRGLPLNSDLVERLFEPFQAPLKTGTGLELALARSNIEAAGGTVRYEQSETGINRIILTFPMRNLIMIGRTA
jgi:K+-sensing histidine kinase KdpD